MLSDTRPRYTQSGATQATSGTGIVGDDVRQTDSWRAELSLTRKRKIKSLLKPERSYW